MIFDNVSAITKLSPHSISMGQKVQYTVYYMIRDAFRMAGIDYKIGTHSMQKTFGYRHYQKYKDAAMLQKIFYSPQKG